MSILAQQDIRNSKKIDTFNELGQTWVRWQENLGIGRPRPETTGYGGYTYSPPGLMAEVGSTNSNHYDGPIGNDIADSDGQYGPPDFARLASKEDGSDNARTLLGAFGLMLNEGSAWGQNSPSQKMKTTFTSSKQAHSLKISTLGVGGAPVASGATVEGYEFGNKYGITNYNGIETRSGESPATATEEISGTLPIENTGLRNIPYMAGRD